MRNGKPTVGVVVPRTGRLAKLGAPLAFAAERARSTLGDRVRIVERDSRSAPELARRAVDELVSADRADVVVTLAGTSVLPAVAGRCEELGVPCVSSTFPWQAYCGDRTGPFTWTYHFSWGIDDIATTFADLWEATGQQRAVGCLWNAGAQGHWLRREFPAAIADRGHRLVEAEPHDEPAADFAPQIEAFQEAGVDVVTSAGTREDLDLFRRQSAELGFEPELITCSRWLTYPHSAPAPGVGTLVYWTPRHPYRSSLDGTTTAELAEEYERATGEQWLQPLGVAHALFEVAVHALDSASDPAQSRAIADALAAARVETIAGTLDWTAGPVPNIAAIPLAGGQWQRGGPHGHELRIVSNRHCPEVPAESEVVPA